MSLTPSEFVVLQEMEREFARARTRRAQQVHRVRAGVWLAGVLALLIGGEMAGNTAAVVLGLTWAVAGPAAVWLHRRFGHYL